MNFRIKVIGLSVVAAAVLAACGGGGGSSVATPTAFPGTVIDGYIEGATVCLDLNVNQACDANEPTATSKVGGTYSLDTTGLTTATIRAAHLLTNVPDTAFDADDTVAGVKKTLAQAGKAPFNLMAPAIAFVAADGTLSSAVISPLTTLVSNDMIVGNGKPLEIAEAAVRLSMNLATDTNLKQDFIALKNTTLHEQAKVIAAVIGIVKNTMPTGTADRDALMAAISYAQQNIVALQTAVTSATGATMVEKVTAALATSALKPDTPALIGEAQKITTTTAIDMTALLKEGFYTLDFNYSCAAASKCPIVNYTKWDGNTSQWFATGYQETVSGWSPFNYNFNNLTLTAIGWVNKSFAGTYSTDAQGVVTAVLTPNGKTVRLSTRMVDISNKTAASIAGLNLPTFVTTSPVTFAPGSMLYWMQATPLADNYTLWTDYQMSVWSYTNGVSSTTNLTNIDQLISAYQTANTSGDKLWTDGNFVTFDAASANSLTGTVTLWSDGVTFCTPAGCYSTSTGMSPPTYTKTGTATYEIKTVFGQQLLIIKANNPDGSNTIFATQGSKLYTGRFEPVGMPQKADANFNKIGMDSILSSYTTLKVVN